MKSLMNTKAVILVALIGLSSYAEGGSLMAPKPQPEQLPACCNGEHILSCTEIDLNLTVIGDGDLYLEPLDTTLTFEGMVDDSTNAYHYGSEHVDFILTVHEEMGSVYGHAQVDDDRSYVIEFCGDDGHVLKELDVQNLGEDVGFNDIMEDEEQTTSTSRVKRSAHLERANRDTITIVTYTVKIYYTPQVAATTSDIAGFIDQVIKETNQGYINSRVPLRVKAHCIEQATINDQNGDAMLTAFRNMKGSDAALRGSADAAALIVNTYDFCGFGYVNSIGSKATISVIRKDCALGYYSFGHELGHNIGLSHNREVESDPSFPNGVGYLIVQGSATTGARTILAYEAAGHKRRVNYYSNPNVNFPGTGTPTGTSTANNARVLTEQRFAMAAVGDESTLCSATTPTVDCSIARTWRTVRHRFQGRMSQSACIAKCTADSNCFFWIRNNSGQLCYFLEARRTSKNPNFSRPEKTSKNRNFSEAGKTSKNRNFPEAKKTSKNRRYEYYAGPNFNERSCYQSKVAFQSNGIAYDAYVKRVTAANANACQAACAAHISCSRWNLYKTSCYLYRTYYKYYPGWTSGQKYPTPQHLK